MAVTEYLIECSCGETAVVFDNPLTRTFECRNPNWRYAGSAEGDRLWHCGQPEHYQASVKPAPPPPPTPPPEAKDA